MSTSNVISPRTHCTIRTSRCLSDAVVPAAGMKSSTCPTPSLVKNRVTSTAVSGKYICFEVYSTPAGRMRKRPPLSSSSKAPNTLGESNRGQQNQSTEPSVVIRAAVCRSPINPWSAMAVSSMAGLPPHRRPGSRLEPLTSGGATGCRAGPDATLTDPAAARLTLRGGLWAPAPEPLSAAAPRGSRPAAARRRWRQRRVHRADAREEAGVGDVDVVQLVRLAVRVQCRGGRVGPEPDGARLVRCRADRHRLVQVEAVVEQAVLQAQVTEHALELVLEALHALDVVLLVVERVQAQFAQ